jgi:transketolase
MNPEPIPAKWRAFGWEVKEINGHDCSQIIQAFDWAVGVRGKPAAIVAHTIKGRGVSFMESKAGWHGVAPSSEEARQALMELGEG